MSNELNPKTPPGNPTVYQIKIEGHLGGQWSDWFGGMNIRLEDNGNTLLAGPVVDQAALFGLLKKVRDLGMPLVSVVRAEPSQTDAPEVSNSQLKQAANLKIAESNKPGGSS
jgi:hypothetical protein